MPCWHEHGAENERARTFDSGNSRLGLTMQLKEGVHPHGIEPELVLGLTIANSVWRDLKLPDLVVTSLLDGAHSSTSLHYAGAAADLRTNNLEPAELATAAAELKRRLGRHYDVLIEVDHIHLEYQPRRPT